jgi:DNA-binding NarL/FixJ family response regulator
MTKILLVDDHQVILDSLSLLLKSIGDIEVVGALNDSRKVLEYIENEAVDLIISDLHMPYFSGIDLCLKIKNNYPQIKVMLLTMAEDAPHIREALQAGVCGYVSKKSTKAELELAIQKIMAGKKYYSDSIIDELAHSTDDHGNNHKPEQIEKLTSREIEILKLITMEYSTGQIADKLYISVPTVESHRGNLMKKLNTKSAIGMAKYAMRHGLVD